MRWRTVRQGAAPRSEGRDRYPQHPPGEISGEVVRDSVPSQKNPKNCSSDVRCPFPAPEPWRGQKPSSSHKYGGRDGSQLEGPNSQSRAHNPKVVPRPPFCVNLQ
jgi:hypothetical protein